MQAASSTIDLQLPDGSLRAALKAAIKRRRRTTSAAPEARYDRRHQEMFRKHGVDPTGWRVRGGGGLASLKMVGVLFHFR